MIVRLDDDTVFSPDDGAHGVKIQKHWVLYLWHVVKFLVAVAIAGGLLWTFRTWVVPIAVVGVLVVGWFAFDIYDLEKTYLILTRERAYKMGLKGFVEDVADFITVNGYEAQDIDYAWPEAFWSMFKMATVKISGGGGKTITFTRAFITKQVLRDLVWLRTKV